MVVYTQKLEHSKERIKRAGATIREYLDGDRDDPTIEDLDEALDVAEAFRAAHQYPLTKIRLGLTSMVRTVGCEPLVGQRLKRMPQMANKLVRFPTMSLARMEDVGGCRAILATRPDIDNVIDRIERQDWEIKYYNDYIDNPRDSGYRGVHTVVVRDERWIEIQLRTHGQHAWATSVETWASQYRLPLKDGQGPDEVLEYFRLAAQGIAHDEGLGGLDADFQDRYERALDKVRQWMHAQQGRQ